MRVVLLSDVHGNLEALEACIAAFPKHEHCVNLGDLVGYGANPNEVIERCRSMCRVFVRGNHDKACAGLMDITSFNPLAAAAALWTYSALKPDNLEWLRALPSGPLTVNGLSDAQVVHGAPHDEDEYVLGADDAKWTMEHTSSAITFFGHSHVQGGFALHNDSAVPLRPEYRGSDDFERDEIRLDRGTHYLLNPGSVGQPRDGDWRASFAIFDSDAYAVTYYRLPYDVETAARKIREAGLPARLADRLALGR